MGRLRFQPMALVVAIVAMNVAGSLAVDCGDVLVGPAAFVLEDDLACPAGPAVTLRDHAVLRMRGHTVRVDVVTTAGIVIEGEGVRLLDGAITSGSVSGALLDVSGSRHVVRDVHAAGHVRGVAIGIRTAPTSHDVSILHSAAEFTWDGLPPVGTAFDLAGAEHRIAGNHGSRAFTGFRLDGSGHRFVRNQAIGTAVGVRVNGTGHLLARTLSTLNGNGIFVAGDGHRILRNRAEANVIGILTLGANTLFQRNVALGNFPDLRDDNLACGTNVWTRNRFETVEVFGGDCIE